MPDTVTEREDQKLALHDLITLAYLERDYVSKKHQAAIRFRNLKGRRITQRVDRGALARPAKILETLNDRGLDRHEFPLPLLRQHIANLDSAEVPVKIVSRRSGWHGSDFLIPGRRAPGQRVSFIARAEDSTGIYRKRYGSTAQHFGHSLAKIMKRSDLVTFGVALALTGPLLLFAKMPESFVVHLHSETSTGKTTLLELMRAIYGASDEGLPSWDQTSRALEEYAGSCRDLPCLIDETSNRESKAHLEQLARRVAFSFTSARGRARSKSVENGMLPGQSMRTIVITTGNDALDLSAGASGAGGDSVRLFNFLVPHAEVGGIIDGGATCALSLTRSKAIFSRLLSLVGGHGGAFGARWVNRLEKRHDTLNDEVLKEVNEFVVSMGDLSTAETRIMQKLGLVAAAGALAARHMNLDWDETQVVAACRRMAFQILNDRQKRHPTDLQLLRQLLEATKRRELFARLKDEEVPASESKLVGYVKRGAKQEIAFKPSQLRTIFGFHVDKRHLFALLTSKQILRGSGKGSTRQVETKGGKRPHYVVLSLRQLKDAVAE